ncbi:sensor histidine kinase [Mesonia aestuariivivens]|uniref:histidine kinase n=1 Tax=Mesonia aestuariivivens TaxID=2796128 RepID=A0ABS6W521_9FLAO|nr:HAMP domain-containing sensor histidine kinase [Mesonia aestuariivivens]MBW2962809.1 HAMP domain-containing histidine kinase [Mesonia aestuariivivens]
MKLKITWLILISIAAFLALSTIQGYLIYNTYTLKRKAFIEDTRSRILNIDYNQELDSIINNWDEELKNQIADYKNHRSTNQEILYRLQQKADTLNKDYYRIYQKELKDKKLGYSVNYKKNIESIVIFGEENDTLFPQKQVQTFKMFGNDFPNEKANSVSVSRTFSQYDYLDQTEDKITTKHYNIELKFKDMMQIVDEKSIVLNQMLGLLVGSVFLFLVMLGLFYYSLKSLITQKKISTIKTDFINNITHELKTPLATLGIAIKSLKNEHILKHPEALTNSLQIIDRQNERIQKLIDQVMNSSLEAGHLQLNRQPINTFAYLNRVVEDFKLSQTKEELTIITSFQKETPSLFIDEFYFTTALFNFLDNAVKYNEADIRIHMTTKQIEDYFFIEISDNGLGIPKPAQKQIFEKFYRVSQGNLHTHQGLGLGLYYSKQIIIAHEGSLEVQSDIRKGSKFIIQIPFAL